MSFILISLLIAAGITLLIYRVRKYLKQKEALEADGKKHWSKNKKVLIILIIAWVTLIIFAEREAGKIAGEADKKEKESNSTMPTKDR